MTYDPPFSTRIRWFFIIIVAIVLVVSLLGGLFSGPDTASGEDADQGAVAPLTKTATPVARSQRTGCYKGEKVSAIESLLGTDLGKGRLRFKYCDRGFVISDIGNAHASAWITGWGESSWWKGAKVLGKHERCIRRTVVGDCLVGRWRAKYRFRQDPPDPAPGNTEYMRITVKCDGGSEHEGGCDADVDKWG